MRLLALLPLLSAVVPAVAWEFDEYYGWRCESDTKIPNSHRSGSGATNQCTETQDRTAKRLQIKDAKGVKFLFYNDSKCSEYVEGADLVSPDDGCHSENGKTFLYTAYKIVEV